MAELQDETTLFYNASSKLTRASTPLEQLEAVSDYARGRGASCGVLFYFEFEEDYYIDVVVAEWVAGKTIPYEVGTRFRLPRVGNRLTPPEGPVFSADTRSASHLSSTTREIDLNHNIQASVILPLYSRGRWVAAILFGWSEPQQFDERDRRNYTVLQQLTAPIVDSVRLFEQTQRRATELDILYAASRQLVAASTPEELLEAASAYARDQGADSGHLIYFENYQPGWCEVVATWAQTPGHEAVLGERVKLEGQSFPDFWMSRPNQPTLVTDVMNFEHLDPISRERFMLHKAQAVAELPLYINSRWVGFISFFWAKPYIFDERDERIFTAIQQHTSPVIDAIRLTEQTQRRTAELEVAKYEMDILYGISRQLVRATTPSEILEAVSVYAREQGARYARLSYFVDFQPHWLEVVAVWASEGDVPTPVGTVLDVTTRRLPQYSMSRPDRPTFVSDLQGSDMSSPDVRQHAMLFDVRSVVQLPMYVNGRWIGILTFDWTEPQNFNERDERIFSALQQQVSPVIDSIRLLDQSRARTLELEQANQEINLLYRTSEIINSANTYEDLVEAVAQFDRDADMVTLMLWENLDWKTSSFVEIMVVVDRVGDSPVKAGDRLPTENFPIAETMLGERVWIIEDALTDSRVDPITAQTWEILNIRAFMGPALYIQQRWIGGITFHSSKPRQYSEREARLIAGVGDLVVAAIQRIRSQQEIEAAKDEIDTLYRVGEVINVANSFTELVNALSGIVSSAEAVALHIWEGWDFENATYVETVAGTGYMQSLIGHRIPVTALSFTNQTLNDRILVIEDVTTDLRFDAATVAGFLQRKQVASISIRLHVNQRWIGALVFQNDKPRTFSEREKRLAVGIGDYVMGAVERIRAREETEAARQRAEAFAEQAQQLAVLEERNRLARELHDSVSQALYGIVLGAQTARTFLDRDPRQSVEPLDYVLALSEAGLAEMRALIFELRPETLEKEGLIEALSKQVMMLQARHGLEVKTMLGPEPSIPIQLKEGVYWIAREALHNIVKHANASTVELRVTCGPDVFMLSIADNGMGFDLDADFSGHLGLKSMSERALKLGGKLHIHSGSGTGTNIQLQLPLNKPL